MQKSGKTAAKPPKAAKPVHMGLNGAELQPTADMKKNSIPKNKPMFNGKQC